jgi:CRISPR-associated protein Cas1
VPVGVALIEEAEAAVAGAFDLAAYGPIPAPLVDSPKCGGCSLNTICLPNETNRLTGIDISGAAQLGLFESARALRYASRPRAGAGPGPLRQLMTPRDDLKPLYLN